MLQAMPKSVLCELNRQTDKQACPEIGIQCPLLAKSNGFPSFWKYHHHHMGDQQASCHVKLNLGQSSVRFVNSAIVGWPRESLRYEEHFNNNKSILLLFLLFVY